MIIYPHYQQYTPSHQHARKVIENYSYALTEQIGKGFSSIVYKGRNDETGEIVAVKVIDKKGLKTQLHYSLLKSEIEALSSIQSQNVMKLFKKITPTLLQNFVMEGIFRVQQLNKDLVREQQMQKLFAGIINGYKSMKMRGIVHRDLKPANILLKNGIPKIADFGFATTPQTQQSMPNVNVGSPLYMSPQAFKNRYSEKSDIWALGVTLYEMLFGQVPWQAGTEKELAYRMQTTPVQFPFQISDECRDLIQRCLTVDENYRYNVEDIERHPWLRQKVQELQLIKQKAFAQKETVVQSPLSDAQNKAMMNQNMTTHFIPGKENTTMLMTGQKIKQDYMLNNNQAYIIKTQKRVRESRHDSQVNQSFDEGPIFKRTEPFQSQRQQLLSFDISQDEMRKNDYVVLAQINLCRYLYRVAGLIDKYDFFQCKLVREKLLFLVNKNIMIKINKLKDMIIKDNNDGSNTLNLLKFNQYVHSVSYNKLCTAIQQYFQKYSLQFNTVWLSLQNPQQKNQVIQDKKFEAVFDDNLIEYESFYIILNSILKNAIRDINSNIENNLVDNDQLQLLPIEIEGGVVLLDYLITYFQLAVLIQDSFDDYYSFAVDSKIEQIADGKPVRLTYGHYNEIRNKIKQLDI
ncbi:hypothetical protein pb186bvf_017350 [Paramecium bursaria]